MCYLKRKKSKIVLLVLCIFAFTQGCLSSEDGGIEVTLKEGSLILPDKTQISIGDSFERLESFTPRYLESIPGNDVYILTNSSSIIIDVDYDNEEISSIDIHLYSLDDAWTEIEKINVDGVVEVSRGMKQKKLMDILEDIGLSYVLDWSKTYSTIVVGLRNGYKASFRFLEEISGGLERVQYWEA